jgi:hypothetical protein
MTDYCVLADCIDPALSIKQRHVDDGNSAVDAMLLGMRIAPALVPLPNETLNKIAKFSTLRIACIEQAIGENSGLIGKANGYKALIDELKADVNRVSLGIAEEVGGGYGSVVLGRS